MNKIIKRSVKNPTDFVQLMRWRFNIYDLAKRGMFYDELVHATFDRMGTLAF